MDAFSRTFLPAASLAGLSIPVVSRHMPVLRRCVRPEDTALLACRGERLDVPMAGSCVFLLTNRSLVVTRESRLLHRVQLHLVSDLRHLSHVVWQPDPPSATIELTATVVDGVRERFRLRVGDPGQVAPLDRLFGHVFRSHVPAAA